MDLGEVEWGDVDWIGPAQDRNRWRALVNSVLNLRVPRNPGKLSSGLTTSGLSSSAELHRVSFSQHCTTVPRRRIYRNDALKKLIFLDPV
jgi:hypothetical protein